MKIKTKLIYTFKVSHIYKGVKVKISGQFPEQHFQIKL